MDTVLRDAMESVSKNVNLMTRTVLPNDEFFRAVQVLRIFLAAEEAKTEATEVLAEYERLGMLIGTSK